MQSDYNEKIERLILISKDKPLLPETFVPWNDEPSETTLFMPEKMVSLSGHALWENLNSQQKIELGRLEMVQVMYSYAWSETLACQFFNRHLLTLHPNSVEYRFLIRELIEEYRHQEMFGMAIRKLDREPIMPTKMHNVFAQITTKYFPPALVYMSVLSTEMMADLYAKHIRKDEKVYSVLRKTSELHHIEEGRHIFYTKAWLDKFTTNVGFFKSTTYCIVVLLNLYFMRSLYIQEKFFSQLGVSEPRKYYKAAIANYNKIYAQYALDDVKELVSSFNGFNWLTRPLWKWILKVKV
jgi:P-aminobenzoate N-oxygenase AurF